MGRTRTVATSESRTRPPSGVSIGICRTLLTEARLRGHERALVVGAATGYAAAVLARLVRALVALEEDEELVAFARKALAGSGVDLVRGPLAKGWAKGAPYDFILIDGAVEQVPAEIVAQAAEGASIALALLDRGVSRLAIGRVVAGALAHGRELDLRAAWPLVAGAFFVSMVAADLVSGIVHWLADTWALFTATVTFGSVPESRLGPETGATNSVFPDMVLIFQVLTVPLFGLVTEIESLLAKPSAVHPGPFAGMLMVRNPKGSMPTVTEPWYGTLAPPCKLIAEVVLASSVLLPLNLVVPLKVMGPAAGLLRLILKLLA